MSLGSSVSVGMLHIHRQWAPGIRQAAALIRSQRIDPDGPCGQRALEVGPRNKTTRSDLCLAAIG